MSTGQFPQPLQASVGLVMIVRDEAKVIDRCLDSAEPLLSAWTICDTGSADDTEAHARAALEGIPGSYHRIGWEGFGPARTKAAELARGTADWLLCIDADMTVEAHPNLLAWLAADPDPNVGAWMVEVLEAGVRYRVPRLVRGDLDWRWEGATHEWLDPQGRKRRELTGLTVHHHADGSGRPDKLERDLKLLRPGYEARDPRSVFYTAETLRCLGHTAESIDAYRERAELGGWDEEAWYASYRAAQLACDLEGLLDAHRQRPWRHEPLAAAARLVAADGARDDWLFLEPAP